MRQSDVSTSAHRELGREQETEGFIGLVIVVVTHTCVGDGHALYNLSSATQRHTLPSRVPIDLPLTPDIVWNCILHSLCCI